MKQTAVEWFYIEMENLRVKAEITNMDGNDFIIAKVKLLNQAKAMEKEQSLKMLPYDLDELVEEIYPICNLGLNATTSLHTLHQESYKAGFQKALELLTFKSE